MQSSSASKKINTIVLVLVADDKMIPIAAQCFVCDGRVRSLREVSGNHAIYGSNPRAVAAIIQAAASTELAAR